VLQRKKAGDLAGFFVPGPSEERNYRRLRAPLRAELLRAAFFRARVRAPLRAEALRAALLPLRGAFFFAAAMLSLHDEVVRSPTPWWNRQVLHRVLTGTRATTKPIDNKLSSA
jgi:hypothetical protein